MVQVQPGKVSSFNPSVTLSGFSSTYSTGDRFLLNGNQFVLAKLNSFRPRITKVSYITRTDVNSFVAYDKFYNSSGDYGIVDNKYYLDFVSGFPATPVHRIEFTFDLTITLSSLKFWSPNSIDTSFLTLETSANGSTWTAVSSLSFSSTFDDTIPIVEGENPPSGQFVYTASFTSVAARYWRFRLDAETTLTSSTGTDPNKTYTVPSTNRFSSSGSLISTAGIITYTGKTSTTFTGCDEPTAGTVTSFIDAITYSSGSSIGGVIQIDTGFGYSWRFVSSVTLPNVGSAKLIYVGPASTSTNTHSFPSEFTATWNTFETISGKNYIRGVSNSFPSGEQYRQILHKHPTTGEVLSTSTFTVEQLILLGYYQFSYTTTSVVAGITLYQPHDLDGLISEVQFSFTPSASLRFWSSNGAEAAPLLLEGTDYYDLTYDTAVGAYVGLIFNTDLNPSSLTFSLDDNFSGSLTDPSFNSLRWTTYSDKPYFSRLPASGTLQYLATSLGDGQIYTKYIFPNDFSSSLSLISILNMPQKSSIAVEAVENLSNNLRMASALLGPYPTGNTAIFAGCTATYLDRSNGLTHLNDFHVNLSETVFDLPGNRLDVNTYYVAASGYYLVSISGVNQANAVPGVPYDNGAVSFTINNLIAPDDGQGIDVQVFLSRTTVGSAVATSGTKLLIERQGTNGYIKYAASNAPNTYVQYFVGSVEEGDCKIRLLGNNLSNTVNLQADHFTASGTASYDSPVFSVICVGTDGQRKQVSGFSDADGYVIKKLSIINDSAAVYGDYRYPRASISTNSLTGSSGALFIKVNDSLYKYSKTQFPLTEDNGSAAIAASTGQIPKEGIAAFAYNGYSQGGLAYIEYDTVLLNYFLKTIRTTDLLSISNKVWLDITSIDKPWAWNPTDLSTLYFVDTNALKLFDLNETKAAFVVVSSDKQVLSAGTGQTANITAQVVNVYGDNKANKSMVFTVSAGDGALSPATDCSDSNGVGTSTYTVGASVGTAVLVVTVSELPC